RTRSGSDGAAAGGEEWEQVRNGLSWEHRSDAFGSNQSAAGVIQSDLERGQVHGKGNDPVGSSKIEDRRYSSERGGRGRSKGSHPSAIFYLPSSLPRERHR